MIKALMYSSCIGIGIISMALGANLYVRHCQDKSQKKGKSKLWHVTWLFNLLCMGILSGALIFYGFINLADDGDKSAEMIDKELAEYLENYKDSQENQDNQEKHSKFFYIPSLGYGYRYRW